jgi:site-specific DNA recombinase
MSIRRGVLENAVLQLLETRLMQPEAVAQFIKMVGEEVNARNGTASAAHAQLQSERVTITRKLEGLYDAIADGLRTTGLKTKLEDLEARLTQIDAALSVPAPTPVRLHPNLSELYRRKVAKLAVTLADPEIRTPALETIRGLIEAVTVHAAPEGITLELEGALAAMVGLAQGETAKSPLESGLGASSVEVVAGAGFEPAAFRL